MKNLIAAIALIAATIAFAAGPTTNLPSVIVAWDITTQTNVDAYAVYWGIATRAYTNSIVVPGRTNTSCLITNLARGVQYHFAATCKAGALESDYSAEALYTTTPLPSFPVNVRITPVTP